MIDNVTLSLFYATDISYICLMTCVDNKPLKRWSNVKTPIGATIYVLVLLYVYIKYGFVLSTAIFLSGTIGLNIIVLCSLRLE